MKLYQVNFENNRAVSAQVLEDRPAKNVDVAITEGKKAIKWISLFADDEQDAMKVADETVNTMLDFI